MERELPWLAQFDTEIIANVAGASEEEYVEVITKLNKSEVVKAYELNISCPNVKHEGIGLGTDPKLAEVLPAWLRKRRKSRLCQKAVTNVPTSQRLPRL